MRCVSVLPELPAARRETAARWLAAGPGARPIDLALLGVPTRAGTAGATGAHATPGAVRRALATLSPYAPARRVDLTRLAPYDRGDVDDPDLGDEGEWRVRIAASGAAQRARLLVAVGGTGTATAGVLDGVHGRDLAHTGLVALDARHDLDDGRGGGAALRRCLALGLPPERVAVVGVADWAQPRGVAEEAATLGVRTFSREMVAARGITATMADALDVAAGGGGAIYVSIDTGCCDAAVVPGCAGALPGGLAARELFAAAHAIGADPRVAAVDVVEADAGADTPDARTARLVAITLLELAAGLAGRPAD
jgi:formiminoglutamase